MQEQRYLIHNAQVFPPSGESSRGWLLVESGRIAGMGAGQPPQFDGDLERIDARGKMLLPGLIDVHVHGAMGHEVMDADPQGLRAMAQFAAQHGVTAFLPTTWTASASAIWAALRGVEQVMGAVEGGASILGAHLEGPFLNPARTGAQDSRLIRHTTEEEAVPYLESGLVRLITLAPEFEENRWLIEACALRGVVASAGHTQASLEQMQEAVQRGLTHVTHCFNAMPGLGHREVGTVGAALALPELNCELIADNIHVHPLVQKMLVQLKGAGRVILVTDALRGTGLPDGDYAIDTRTITIREGAARLPDGMLAGSTLTMERALGHLVENAGRPLCELWPASSLTAARELGISHRKGSLEVGKDADLVLLDEHYGVALTLVQGRAVYRRGEI